MIDKQKAIEEMAVELAKINCKSAGCENCDCAYEYGTKLASCEDYVHYYQMAEKLYNVGFGNIPQSLTEFANWLIEMMDSYCNDNKTMEEVIKECLTAYLKEFIPNVSDLS